MIMTRRCTSMLYPALVLALALTVLTGCARSYTAQPDTYDMEILPEFTPSGPVTLVNNQPSTKEIVYATDGVQEFKANLHDWTDTAITIVEREITLRGGSVGPTASKELELAIVSVTTTTGGWGWRTFTNLDVTTGDGYRNRYVGEGPSISAFRAADASVMRAVAEMFRDEKILEYLSR